MDQGVDPILEMELLTAKKKHGQIETESNRALSAVDEFSNIKLNIWVSNMLESLFCCTEGAERIASICSAISGGTFGLKYATAEQR